MIAKRVSVGYNFEESVALLEDTLYSHDGDNLVSALCYEGFATEKQGYQLIELLLLEN